MNLLLALALLTIALGPLAERGAIVVGDVQPGSPAAGANIVAGDRIIEIDGLPFDRQATPLLNLRDRGGETIEFTVRHANGISERHWIRLRDGALAATQGALGITVPEVAADGPLPVSVVDAFPREIGRAHV